MNYPELLLTSGQNSQQFSVCLWDFSTLNVKKYYKNGGSVAPKCLECLGEDYILSAEIGRPLIQVWPINSQDVAKSIRLILPEPAMCLAVCPQNIFLAVGIGAKVFIWQLTSGKLLCVQQKHYQSVTCIKFSSESDYILVGGQDGMLVAYLTSDIVSVVTNFMEQQDIGQSEPLYVKNDHSMPITDMHIGNFGGKSRFATVSTDQTCRIYNLKDGENLLTLIFNTTLSSVVFDAACWNLFVGGDLGSIRQYNLRSPARSLSQHVDNKTSLIFTGHKKKITCLALNRMGSILASGSEDNFVLIWEIKSRQILKKIEHKSPITNIKFVTNNDNFFTDNFNPEIVLKNLQRSHDGSTDFVVSRLQTEDMQLDDEDKAWTVLRTNEELLQENRKLRSINKQVYNVALSKTVNLNNN